MMSRFSTFSFALAVFVAANENAVSVGAHALSRAPRAVATICPAGCVCKTNPHPSFTCNGVEAIDTVPATIGSGMIVVDLQNNNVATIPDDSFDACSASLYTLNLNGNKIKTVNKRPFQYLLALRNLQLHDNAIESIEAGAFDGLRKLATLNLQSNMLTYIRGLALQNVGRLSSLFLGDNYIDAYSTSPDTFGGLTRLSTLRITGNIIDCDVTPNSMDVDGARVNYESCTCTDGLVAITTEEESVKVVRCQEPTTVTTSVTETSTTATITSTSATVSSTTATDTSATETASSTSATDTSTTATGTSTTATATSTTATQTSTTATITSTSATVSSTTASDTSTSATATTAITEEAASITAGAIVGIVSTATDGENTLAAAKKAKGISSAGVAGIGGGVFLMVLVLAGMIWQKSMKQGEYLSSSAPNSEKVSGNSVFPKRGSNSIFPKSESKSVLKTPASTSSLKKTAVSNPTFEADRKDAYISIRRSAENVYHLAIPVNQTSNPAYSVANALASEERVYENSGGGATE